MTLRRDNLGLGMFHQKQRSKLKRTYSGLPHLRATEKTSTVFRASVLGFEVQGFEVSDKASRPAI